MSTIAAPGVDTFSGLPPTSRTEAFTATPRKRARFLANLHVTGQHQPNVEVIESLGINVVSLGTIFVNKAPHKSLESLIRAGVATLVLCFFTLGIQGCARERVNGVPSEQTVETTEKKAAMLETIAAADGGKKSPPPSQMISKAEVQAVDPSGNEPLNDAITCLSRTIYWEARGEGVGSMEAVTNVVMNRLGHDGFPNTICEVVMQGREQGACQFSWWCDGRPDSAEEDDSYAIAKEIARKALNGQLTDQTDGALYFHQRTASPSWSRQYIKTVAVGEFVFYKPDDRAAK